MEGEIRFELITNGISGGESTPLAKHDQHPGFDWGKLWDLVVESIKSYYTDDPEEAINAAKEIFKGSQQQYVANSLLPLFNFSNGGYDTIRIIFRAWSEDELKSSTCTSMASLQAIKVRENIQAKSYEVAYDINTKNLPHQTQNIHFMFGAQDDGWMNDTAICSILDIVYSEIPVPPA